jgi:hypothetical protein
MDVYKYEQARSRKEDKSLYDFQRSSAEDENSKVVSDFWNELKRDDNPTDDDDENKVKRNISFSQRLRSYGANIVDFYRPFPHSIVRPNDDGFDPPDEFDITTVSNIEREVKQISYQMRLGSCVLCGVSFFFWCWAIKNTLTMKSGQDLGIYSFFTTLLSSHYVLWKTRRPISRSNPLATSWNRVIITLSHVLVFLNYCLGVLFAFTVGSHVYYIFGTYCIIFCGLWGYVSFRGLILMSSLQRYESELARDDEVGDELDSDNYF